MQHHTDHHALASRLVELSEAISAGCDPDFDTCQEELEREFSELRLHVGSHG